MEIHMKYVFPFGNPYENLELHIFFAVVFVYHIFLLNLFILYTPSACSKKLPTKHAVQTCFFCPSDVRT